MPSSCRMVRQDELGPKRERFARQRDGQNIELGSRITGRFLRIEFCRADELLACLEHLLAGAGNASLMTSQLRHTLCDHAAGNYRVLTTMAAELLACAAQKDLSVLDEKLYLDVFAPPAKPTVRRAAQGR